MKLAEHYFPGEFIREEIESRGWTIEDFAERIKLPVEVVNAILDGITPVTREIAENIGYVFRTGPELWLNLEKSYRDFSEREND